MDALNCGNFTVIHNDQSFIRGVGWSAAGAGLAYGTLNLATTTALLIAVAAMSADKARLAEKGFEKEMAKGEAMTTGAIATIATIGTTILSGLAGLCLQNGIYHLGPEYTVAVPEL